MLHFFAAVSFRETTLSRQVATGAICGDKMVRASAQKLCSRNRTCGQPLCTVWIPNVQQGSLHHDMCRLIRAVYDNCMALIRDLDVLLVQSGLATTLA